MKIIQKILVPTDFSDSAENAYHLSLRLAEKWQASVKLLHIVSPDFGVTDLPLVVDLATKEKMEVAQQILTNFKELGLSAVFSAGQEAPTVTDEIRVGISPLGMILHAANEEDFDLVVMGTNLRHSALEQFFGSQAASVAQQAACDVLVVPEEARFQDFKTVGFAANLHETDPYHLRNACKMLAPFHPIIRCFHIEKEGKPDNTPLSMEELASFFDNAEGALQISFHNFQEPSVAAGLAAFADAWELDLLVMPSLHRDLFSQFFHKSMTKLIAMHTKVPLLVLK